MTTLEFTVDIEASPTEVWDKLWDHDSYTAWTSKFCEGSYYKSDDLKPGTKIHFLTPSGEGMYSVIETVEPSKEMVFRHQGEIKDFQEQPIPEGKGWNSEESYRLFPIEMGTRLVTRVETLEEYVEPMNKMFPEALQELKRICED